MNIKAIVSAAAFITTIAGSSAAFAQTTTGVPPATVPGMHAGMRGEHMSDHNIRAVHRRLGRIIDSLQRDQHDYDGHRVKAVQLLQQARAELEQAIQYDKAHPGT